MTASRRDQLASRPGQCAYGHLGRDPTLINSGLTQSRYPHERMSAREVIRLAQVVCIPASAALRIIPTRPVTPRRKRGMYLTRKSRAVKLCRAQRLVSFAAFFP